MIKSNPYIFIHIPKTGGRSITGKGRIAPVSTLFSKVGRHLVEPEYCKKLYEDIDQPAISHCRWRDLKQETHQKHKFFSIVRNPWARVVSQHHFLHQKRPRDSLSFKEFLDLRPDNNLPRKYDQFRPILGWMRQMEYVTDEKGDLKVDILRIEYLQEDLSKYLDTKIEVPHINKSNVKNIDYRKIYDTETQQIVADWYADDIEFFGFDFEGPATKNIFS